MNRARLLYLSLTVSLAFSAGPDKAGGGLNPASPGLPAVDNVYGRNGVTGNGASAMCVSCHTAVPIPGMTSHFTSHYSAGAGGVLTTTAVNQAAKERLSSWTGSGWSSRYGKDLSTAPASDNTIRGEVICESCHSLLRNVAGGNNLLESSRIGDPRPVPNDKDQPSTTLCEGCHDAASLPGKHPMTDDPVSGGGVLSTADTAFTRGFVSSGTEMGGSGSGVFYPAANRLPCLSCHGNGHQGFQGTGARILRRGYGKGAAPGGAVAGLDNTGIDRQFEIDPASTPTSGTRMIQDPAPLCDSCHKTND